MTRFSDRVRLTRSREDTDRPVTAYIRGTELSLLFDAGNSLKHAEEILRELLDDGLAPPDIVVVSHAHCDHWFGLSALPGVSFCSEPTRRKIESRMKLDWTSDAVRKRLAAGEEDEITAYMLDVEYGRDRGRIPLKAPDCAVPRAVRFHLGGLECLFEHVGGNHADDSSVLFVEQEKLLFLGDIMYIREFSRDVVDGLAGTIFSYGATYFVDSHEDRVYTVPELEKRLEDLASSGARI